MPDNDPWTIGRLLNWTADYLAARGADSPRLDAEILLAEALGCRRIELYTTYEEVPGDQPRTRFREFVKQRAEGTPVAYLVGRREFYSLEFRVTPDVLIPRPETELLVVEAIDLARKREASDGPPAVADVGTGSGIIAVCLARQVPDCRVTAVDVSPAALQVARENAAAHDVAQRIEFLQSDLLSAVDPARQFDLVLSNPPYVAESEVDALPVEVRQFEPRGALVAGTKGTEVIEQLVPQAAERLKPGGHLLVEIGPAIEEPVRALFEADGRFELRPTIRDLARLPRVVVGRRRDLGIGTG